MRAIVQRVSSATVRLTRRAGGAIDGGLLVYLGVGVGDGDEDVAHLADKVRHLRIFPDDNDRMNLDVVQANGKVLAVSAFSVQADARRGRRPAFDPAAAPEDALRLFEAFCDALAHMGVAVERGSFGNYMDVESVNAGPVCILLDSRRAF